MNATAHHADRHDPLEQVRARLDNGEPTLTELARATGLSCIGAASCGAEPAARCS